MFQSFRHLQMSCIRMPNIPWPKTVNSLTENYTNQELIKIVLNLYETLQLIVKFIVEASIKNRIKNYLRSEETIYRVGN
jgi:hypothetical protein